MSTINGTMNGGDDDGTNGVLEEASTPAPYSKTTHGVAIAVEPFFLESHSVPALGHYVWAYRVRIANRRGGPVKLLTRYWRITDSAGAVQEVFGEGVVGEQPLIQPGDAYEYTSGAPLTTPSGLMSGRYEMETLDGDRLDIEIPAFSLDSPHEAARAN